MFVCSCLLKSLRYVLTHSAGLWSSAEGKLRTNKIGQVLSLSPQNWSPHSMERKRREDLTPATQTTLATTSRLANLGFGSPSWNLSKIFSTSEIKVKGTLNARWNCKIYLCHKEENLNNYDYAEGDFIRHNIF